MDPESKKLLVNALNLAKENNEILKEVRRSLRISRFMTMMYWVLIVGSAVGAFYFAQPFIDQFMSVYRGAGSVFSELTE